MSLIPTHLLQYFLSEYFPTKVKYFIPKCVISNTDFGDPTRHVAKVETKTNTSMSNSY